jgi:hypothetical protein
MATKKAASKTTALVPWTEKFSKYATQAKEQVAKIGAGGVGVKFGRGSISVGGVTVPGGKMECIILGSCALNAWYEADYDPNDAQPPDCYAFAVISDDPDMAPSDDVPNKQSDKCADCEKNQFGTAKTGRGKACGNNIRLGLILAKDAEDAASISSAELATAKISPTNLKNYAGYVKAMEEEHGRPLWAVATEISSHDDPKTQIRVEFKLLSLIEDDEILTALEKRFLRIQDVLQTPFSAAAVKPAKKPAARGGSQKFAGNKSVGRR